MGFRSRRDAEGALSLTDRSDPSLREGCWGVFLPHHPEPSAARVGCPEGQSPFGLAKRKKASRLVEALTQEGRMPDWPKPVGNGF